MKTIQQANGKPVRVIDGPLMPRNSRPFEVGKADTLYGIRNWPPGGTDNYATLADWKAAMEAAAGKCADRQYAAGVLAALATI